MSGHSVAFSGNRTYGFLLRIQVDGNLTRARNISPVRVADTPVLENPVIEVTLPVALRELIEKLTTFGNAKAKAIVS